MCYYFAGTVLFFFFKQKTAYEMRISDWSSDVCSSDLVGGGDAGEVAEAAGRILDHFRFGDGLEIVGGANDIVGDQMRHMAGDREHQIMVARLHQIGRASCRERVCQYV